MPPYWFLVNGKPIVLFLDELNRARPEILQTVMDLALNRKLAGKKLPEDSQIISALGNIISTGSVVKEYLRICLMLFGLILNKILQA